ncbi:peptidase MA family metallohydrolase [Sporomusa aerivorans]|uniref:peptidase MA family metallohydrolase n=1 Tax=Sporomusa aerivorans TaxID=204936 RepID=UPI00352BCF3C
MRDLLEMIPGGVPAVVGLVVAGLLLTTLPLHPQMWLYPLVRQAVELKIRYQTSDMLAKETPHFIIKYTEQDADMVDMVATAAEAAYKPVTTVLDYTPRGKAIVLIYPDRQAMKKAYGWAGDASAMGFYWGGVIQILSPKAWMKNSQAVEEFITTGPLAHEYTHLVLDHMARGNYTRWFTEGLAQYMEYKANGYEWITVDNRLTGKLYTMAELEGDFDGLPNQALAYRQSLAAVRYIAEVHGEAKLNEILRSVTAGQKVNKAIKRALGMDYTTFETMVNLWAKGHMKQYSKTAN